MKIRDDLTVSVIDVLNFSRKSGRYKTRKRDFSALSFRLHAESVFEYEKGRIHVGDGDMAFVPGGVEYTSFTRGENMIVVHFRMCNCEDDRIHSFTPKNPDDFLPLFRQMEQLWSEKKPGYQLRTTAVFYEVLAQIQEQSDNERLKANEKENRYALAATYMRDNLADPTLTMEKVAEKLNICESLLRREFRKYYGVCPKQYLQHLRMEYAVLLRNTGYFSQKEIAAKCGYSDVKYFRTAFRKKNGVPLSAFRYRFEK